MIVENLTQIEAALKSIPTSTQGHDVDQQSQNIDAIVDYISREANRLLSALTRKEKQGLTIVPTQSVLIVGNAFGMVQLKSL
jgi:hypothetical protein